MELHKIELLLEKYFDGETTINEENELKAYFSSNEVAIHLEKYKPLFGFYIQEKTQKIALKSPQHKTRRALKWISIAASIVAMLGVGTLAYLNQPTVTEYQELGTYDDPEKALRATQQALALLSNHVNMGIESVQYIQQYESTVDKAFVAY